MKNIVDQHVHFYLAIVSNQRFCDALIGVWQIYFKINCCFPEPWHNKMQQSLYRNCRVQQS
jgi:hypothetical protein